MLRGGAKHTLDAATGLTPVQRCAALLAGLRDGQLIPRASIFQLDHVRKLRASASLAKVSERSVRRLADAGSFRRGRAYFDAGRVGRFTVDGRAATATVDGTSVYRVRLEITTGGLDGECSCPYGQEGAFCKHCVAAALAWVEAGGTAAELQAQPVTDEGLHAFLRAQDPAQLAEYALALLEDAAALVDDSDGGLRAAIEQAEQIHLDACAAGDPDPVRLAELLVHRALVSDHEVFLTALSDYEPVLGPIGMARYSELVESAWRDLPPKKPYDSAAAGSLSPT